MFFERMFNSDQKENCFERLKNTETNSPPISLKLAEMYHTRQQPELALQTLRRAAAQLWIDRDNNHDWKKRIKKLAKKLGDPQFLDQTPDPQWLRDVGFTQLNADSPSFEKTLILDEPLKLFVVDEQNELKSYVIRIAQPDPQNEVYELKLFERQGLGSQSWGDSGGYQRPDGAWTALYSRDPGPFRFDCNIIAADPPGRFRAVVNITN